MLKRVFLIVFRWHIIIKNVCVKKQNCRRKRSLLLHCAKNKQLWHTTKSI